MRSLLFAGLLALGCLVVRTPAEAQDTPVRELDPVLKKLSLLVGGTWVTDDKGPSGQPLAEVKFGWSEDGKTLVATGVIGQGTPKPMHSHARVGWDPVAKKAYYLDAHGSETVYFGHARLDGDAVVYEFKTIVGTPSSWEIRETYPDNDTMKSVFRRVVDGKPAGQSFTLTMKRVR